MFELDGRTFAFVVEGLGTKSIIARQVLEAQGINRFADVAYDTVAAIVNDLCCVGALPLVVNAYFATGASEWYREPERAAALLEGWRRACADAGCAWGGGESPSLPGLLDEREIELAGAAVGAVPDGRAPILGRAAAGRAMRSCSWPPAACTPTGPRWRGCVAGRLHGGLRDRACRAGRRWARRCCEPSVMYVSARAALLERGVPLTYISHITGHGLLKLMRPAKRADLPHRASCPRCPRCWASWWRRRGWTRTRRTRRSTWAPAMPSTAPPGAGEAVVEVAAGLGLRALCSRGAWRRGRGR